MPGPERPVTPVGILAHRLSELSERAQAGDIDTAELLDGLRAAHALAAGLEPYVSSVTSPESPALAALARRTAARDWAARTGPEAIVELEAEMLSGHVEGTLLKFLVRISGARRVLEIGMFTGYSALAMAEALPEDGHVIACELDPDVAAFARQNFDESSAGTRIEVRVGPGGESLDALAREHQRFDLVFIDADKGGYQGYLDAVLDGDLLAPDGLICVDNTLYQGQPYRDGERTVNGAAIAAFNAAVAADPRVEQVLVPLRDGVTLIRRV